MFNAEQADNYLVIGDVALTNMAVGNKAAALVLSKQAMNVVGSRKTRSMVSPYQGAIAALQKLLPIPWPRARRRHADRSRLHCSGSIQCSIHSETMRALRSS